MALADSSPAAQPVVAFNHLADPRDALRLAGALRFMAELAARPEMVKTMKVKPPVGQGRVRLVRIGDVDLQPCGGTHVRSTAEIGPLRIGRIEKKGRENRRVNLHFAE